MASVIFEKLNNHWDKSKFKSYRYQDFNNAGKEEWEEIYLSEPVSGYIKNDFANGLLELFLSFINEDTDLDSIKNYLNKFPIIQYYFVLVDKIKVLWKEGILSDKVVKQLGMEFSTEYEESGLIKLGLTLLRFSGDEEALNILLAYSNHNEYIFYAIEGIKEYKGCNSIIFSITKASTGYGKIMAITNLEPLNGEIREWIIEHGSESDMLQSVLLAMTYREDDYLNYFSNNISKKKYMLFTKKIDLMYDAKDYFKESLSLEMVLLYWDYYKKYKGDFINRFVMTSLLSLFVEAGTDNNLSYYDNLQIEEEVILNQIIEEFLEENHEEVIFNEIQNGKYHISQVLSFAEALDIYVSFEELYKYIMKNGRDDDKEKLLRFGSENLPLEIIAEGAQNITEEDINEEFMADSCLYILINAMDNLREKYIELNIKGLRARYNKTRVESLNNIIAIDRNIINEYKDELYNISVEETDNNILKNLLRYLETFNQDKEIPKMINTKSIELDPNVRDIYLIKTEIAGIKYNHIYLVEELIENGYLVYLKRDISNVYDENAIMIVASNGQRIGYVPRNCNEILRNLMDNGKMLYGIISNILEDLLGIEIDIYLSHNDVVEEVTNTLNMLTEKPVGYIN